MDNTLRILMLEDSCTDAELVKRELGKSQVLFTACQVETKNAFELALREFRPDIIFSDYNLPGFDGLSALAMARRECAQTPFIFVSGAIGEDRAIDALKQGATDYVLKDRLSRLVPAFNRAVEDINRRAAVERMQEDLQASEDRFKVFMDNSPAVAFLKTQDGRYVYANKLFERRFNLLEKDWLGKTDADLWSDDMARHLRDNDQMVLDSGRALELMENVPTPDGVLRSWLAFKFPVRAGSRMFLGGMAVDITESKRMETQLKEVIGELARLNAELDKNNEELKNLDRLKSDLLSTVSHELRTPMTIMRESISQILHRICGDVTALQEELLSSTLNNLDRLRRIVDNLLDVAKFESGRAELHKELVDLVQLVKDICFSFEPQITGKKLELRMLFSGDKIEASIDKDKIIQVFVNLLNNAVKFTDTGYIGIEIKENDRDIECRITDSGKGIEKNDIPKVFNKFEQFGRQDGPGEKGTGLGLVICKEIIKLHRGEVWMQSQFGCGTTVIFTLPKFSFKELFLEELQRYLNEFSPETDCLAVLVFEVDNFSAIREQLHPARMDFLERNILRMIRQCLRSEVDRVIYSGRCVMAVLPRMDKDGALIVAGRIHQILDDFLAKENVRNKIEMTIQTAEYPKDGSTAEQLLEKTGLR